METLESTNQLQKIVSDSNLDKSKSEVLLEKFSNYFEIAAEWERKIKEITVLKAKAEAEAKLKMEQAIEKKAKLAPDKDKIQRLAIVFDEFEFPVVKSEEANKIISDAKTLIAKVSVFLKERSSSL